MTAASDSLTKLHSLLVEHFDLDELRTLCFDLGVDYDELRGEVKSTKARELITVMLRHNRVAELAGKLQVLRPNVDWPDLETLSSEERLAWTTATEMQSAADYLVALCDYCANLPYLTLHDIRPPKTLDEVYVPLKARPQPRKDEKRERDEERAIRELERSEPLSISDVMRQHDPPHVLILGEPGAGKSTLLRQLAEHAWDVPDKIGLDAPHLPILVPLRRLASAEGALEERLNRALTAELTLTQALPQGFFTNWPRQTGANWLILLDALDEVPAEQRPQLMQWLRGLFGHIGQDRVVLTSRPSGYAQGELDDKLFSHYDLLSFMPDQTGEFAQKWFGDKAEPFLKELERVRSGALSGTPLLLTIAAKVYLGKGALPERRSGLYGHFVDIWLAEAEQRGLRVELGDAICDVAKFALAHLALAMTEQPTQTEASLSEVAADYLRDAVPLTPERAKIAGERFLKVMARRSGVLTRRGDDHDFIHPTFREYLAASMVVHEHKQNQEQVWWHAISRWAERKWFDVALFALSILSDAGQEVTPLLERIWKHGGYFGMYFAWAALAEPVQVDKRLSDAIIDDLVARAHEMETWALLAFPDPVGILYELRSYSRASEGLLSLAHDEQVDASVRERAAKALGKLGRVNEATSILLTLARDEKVNGYVRKRAADALSELGQADPATQAWLALAGDEQVDAGVRKQSAEALDRLERTDQAAQAWLALAHDEQVVPWMRARAAEALGNLGRVNDLLELACNKKVDRYVRVKAAEALSGLKRASEATPILLELACDERVHEDVRIQAIKVMGRFVDARVLPDLERMAQEDSEVRHAAQRAIEQIRRRADHNQADTQTTPPRQD